MSPATPVQPPAGQASPSSQLPKDWAERGLSPLAARSGSATRQVPEEPCPWRSHFQRDRDRIIHAKAFRRLAHKTQVFVATSSDHFRTRLTHTLEVSQVARTLARGFALNEDLTEAISLGHDLGHTPFGHAGEEVLDELNPFGFHHQDHSVRVVTRLAKNGAGLNLTREVIDGISKHSKGRGPIFAAGPFRPLTHEAQLVRVADIIAYLAHDLDDALESGLLGLDEIPPELDSFFGHRASARIGVMVEDLLTQSKVSDDDMEFRFSPKTHKSMVDLRSFLDLKVYRHPLLASQLAFGQSCIKYIFVVLMENKGLFETLPMRHLAETRVQAVCDFIAGMTDRYAFAYAQNLSRGLATAKFTPINPDDVPSFLEF
ncbi:MAG: deoxyguanosinetriphosphate triphosphohydrolase [Deltaproteobacteria bacterium]|jgi:dGTPase|nr:deoxyguanosinetriphosphate triphosphohydrolase [Deltaproteobacteria bacterium]